MLHLQNADHHLLLQRFLITRASSIRSSTSRAKRDTSSTLPAVQLPADAAALPVDAWLADGSDLPPPVQTVSPRTSQDGSAAAAANAGSSRPAQYASDGAFGGCDSLLPANMKATPVLLALKRAMQCQEAKTKFESLRKCIAVHLSHPVQLVF